MKKVLIVFPDIHLSYSPSILNLYESLEKYFNVTIITFLPNDAYSTHKIENKNIVYLSSEPLPTGVPLITRLANEVKRSYSAKVKENDPLLSSKAKILIEKIRAFDGVIIAVDFFALWTAQQAGKHAHLFSLEIIEKDIYRSACNLGSILSVVIQTYDRYEYLFGQKIIKTFLVQNAPNYIEKAIDYSSRKKTDLVFCGSAMPAFGIISCIEFLLDHPGYVLTVKGAIPPSVRKSIAGNFEFLITQKRLILNDDYLSVEDLNNFLSHYYIGFVFYDAARFDHINTFNYNTAPSGKLFQCFNAGVPVVVSNIKGLKAVEEFGAGIMIDSLNSGAIKNAIAQIDLNYIQFAQASKKASVQFDFSKAIKPYISFLQEQ